MKLRIGVSVALLVIIWTAILIPLVLRHKGFSLIMAQDAAAPLLDRSLALLGALLTLLTVLVAYALFVRQGIDEAIAWLRKWAEDERIALQDEKDPNSKLVRSAVYKRIVGLLESSTVTAENLHIAGLNAPASAFFYMSRWFSMHRSVQTVKVLLRTILLLIVVTSLSIFSETEYLMGGSLASDWHVAAIIIFDSALLLVPFSAVVIVCVASRLE